MSLQLPGLSPPALSPHGSCMTSTGNMPPPLSCASHCNRSNYFGGADIDALAQRHYCNTAEASRTAPQAPGTAAQVRCPSARTTAALAFASRRISSNTASQEGGAWLAGMTSAPHCPCLCLQLGPGWCSFGLNPCIPSSLVASAPSKPDWECQAGSKGGKCCPAAHLLLQQAGSNRCTYSSQSEASNLGSIRASWQSLLGGQITLPG